MKKARNGALSFACWLVLVSSVPAFACWQMNWPNAVVHGDYVQGHVYRNGRPLVGAKIVLRKVSQGPRARAVTDRDGRFVVRHIPPGKYRLGIAMWGDADIEVEPADVKIGNRILKLTSVDDGCLYIESES